MPSDATAMTMEHKLIISTIRECLGKLGMQPDDVVLSESGGNTVFTIKTKDPSILIGTNGEVLSALNHLVKKMLEGVVPREEHYIIDVNGFQSKKVKSLEDQARTVAERARTFRYDIEMSPMSAYERMIVHSTLKSIPNIETESEGEGPLRHIVVRYKDPTTPQSTPNGASM